MSRSDYNVTSRLKQLRSEGDFLPFLLMKSKNHETGLCKAVMVACLRAASEQSGRDSLMGSEDWLHAGGGTNKSIY